MLIIPDFDNTSDVAGDEERSVGGKLEFGSSGSDFLATTFRWTPFEHASIVIDAKEFALPWIWMP